ncbi:unnamed protein product, partial [Vitis vinifera]|uniref:Uncharacterized protein n=1 Tax=Vitis vinifera TaxID=29760 RepID=D7TNG5_VITVI
MRHLHPPSRPSSNRMRFTLFHLICVVVFFSLFVFGIQSSLFTTNSKISNNINI